MSKPTHKPMFEDEPIESQLEIFKLAEQFLNIQNRINQRRSTFSFSDVPFITYMGETSVEEVFKIAKEGSKTEIAHLGKVRHGIKTLEKQVKEQKDMAEVLKECGDLNETAKRVSKGLVSKRRLEDCDKLEEQALKVLEACKRLKGAGE